MITLLNHSGRNFNEILRVIDSLQLSDKKKVATPGTCLYFSAVFVQSLSDFFPLCFAADWEKGKQCIVLPTMSDEDAKKNFGEFTKLRSYFRTVDAKNLEDKKDGDKK
jgi:peroxiredoxin (alkyl hydroperoxide reductase subunit C)